MYLYVYIKILPNNLSKKFCLWNISWAIANCTEFRLENINNKPNKLIKLNIFN